MVLSEAQPLQSNDRRPFTTQRLHPFEISNEDEPVDTDRHSDSATSHSEEQIKPRRNPRRAAAVAVRNFEVVSKSFCSSYSFGD